MSIVTNLLINIATLDVEEDEKVKEINDFFIGQGYGAVIILDDPKLPKGWYGGNKYLEVDLYSGAFNNLNLTKLIHHINSLDWPGPYTVQLLVQEQDEMKFKIIDVIDHGWD
jgi:hypothetical protein